MPCTENVASEDYADFITPYYNLPSEYLAEAYTDCVDFINHQYAVLYVPLNFVSPLSLSSFYYDTIPKLFSLQDSAGVEATGISQAVRLPALSNGGRGTLIGFIDTGIDYQNPIFRNQDGSTRLLGIWDQTHGNGNTIPGNTFRTLYGTQYTQEQIDQALRSDDPFSVVPSRDENGHGTFLASVAAGGVDESAGFAGAAPKASIAVVKLKPAKQYLRDFFQIREGADAYQENDIMMGITYLYALARQYFMPVVICLGLGTNQGSHDGISPLCTYLNEMSTFVGSAIIVSAGNETGYGHHYHGISTQGGTQNDVELRVGENESGFSMELWARNIELYRIGFVSPSGEIVRELPAISENEDVITFLLDETEINVFSSIVNVATGNQLIFIRFKKPLPGIWHIIVYSSIDIQGDFHIWLPSQGFISDDTTFLRPDPDTLIMCPGNANYPITVAAYDYRTEGIYIHSSRGFSRSGQIKPEIAAPGVEILGAGTGAAPFIRMTGTSAAAAYAAGAAAILLHWGILEGNDLFMTTSGIKSYFIRGATRNPGLTYPNKEFGYGTLDLYQSFLSLRS
ncbi:MAG: S8 family peptidase [Lachnospiraceae bacterium]|jgi:subtilisin family serine protease|nr:S8 family peptidase [Lachnospiraceae bacterium]